MLGAAVTRPRSTAGSVGEGTDGICCAASKALPSLGVESDVFIPAGLKSVPGVLLLDSLGHLKGHFSPVH